VQQPAEFGDVGIQAGGAVGLPVSGIDLILGKLGDNGACDFQVVLQPAGFREALRRQGCSTL
jgi:hypothetical protein